MLFIMDMMVIYNGLWKPVRFNHNYQNLFLQNPNNQPFAFPYLSLLNYKHRRALSLKSPSFSNKDVN